MVVADVLMLISLCSKQSLVIITDVFQTILSNYHHCADVNVRCSIQHIAVIVIVLKWILGVPSSIWQLLSLY